MSISELIGLIGGIAGLISLAVAFWIGRQQTSIAGHAMYISIAADIHERYYRLFPMIASLSKQDIKKLSEEQQQALSQYINLCAEEYFWKEKGIIRREV